MSCIGCKSNDSYCSIQIVLAIDDVEPCPCGNCLIKMVCEEECNELTKYLIPLMSLQQGNEYDKVIKR